MIDINFGNVLLQILVCIFGLGIITLVICFLIFSIKALSIYIKKNK
ncbi:hypothetical protein SAMN05444487_10970 [Marininema mesophilum]|uniref:Oxaloacetate decarboxylase, gamma chain n=1 Tax=Marininema mesophilum TaxID=1048340 RepID=A0A1H2YHA2_9BACL|nr:hypothetical protein SAMN05444487_10970 [Marininema mesophilum]